MRSKDSYQKLILRNKGFIPLRFSEEYFYSNKHLVIEEIKKVIRDNTEAT